jgi:hypothetical protein
MTLLGPTGLNPLRCRAVQLGLTVVEESSSAAVDLALPLPEL